MIAFPDAQCAIVAACRALPLESVSLEAATGRIAGQTVYADEDLIPFARSAMDGYAVFAEDVRAFPVTLPVAAATFAAPAHADERHARGTATAIATGAALPTGADAVVPFEDVARVGETVRIERHVRSGDAVFPPGEDARAGDELLQAGRTIAPAMLGILAASGHARVVVHRRPVVSIICGGDELVPIDARPGHGQIRNSNAPVLAATLAAFGADVRTVETIADRRELLQTALRAAFETSDLVVTTGGASVGERDYIKSICRELGVTFAFETVALRPAKPTAFGTLGATVIAILPGNPAAAFVALYEFVRPAVRALGGEIEPFVSRITARLEGTINAKSERHFAAFAALTATSNGLTVRPLENQCSSLTRTIAESGGFILVPPGSHTYRTGDPVAVDVVDWTKLETRS